MNGQAFSQIFIPIFFFIPYLEMNSSEVSENPKNIIMTVQFQFTPDKFNRDNIHDS